MASGGRLNAGERLYACDSRDTAPRLQQLKSRTEIAERFAIRHGRSVGRRIQGHRPRAQGRRRFRASPKRCTRIQRQYFVKTQVRTYDSIHSDEHSNRFERALGHRLSICAAWSYRASTPICRFQSIGKVSICPFKAATLGLRTEPSSRRKLECHGARFASSAVWNLRSRHWRGTWQLLYFFHGPCRIVWRYFVVASCQNCRSWLAANLPAWRLLAPRDYLFHFPEARNHLPAPKRACPI